MRVNRTSVKESISKEKKINSNMNDFAGSYKQEKNKKSKEELIKMAEDIKLIGEKISITKNLMDILNYKNHIKNYLEQSLNYLYEIDKNQSIWGKKYFIIVDTIDKELKNLVDDLINSETHNMNIANSIEAINGLIINTYR